MLSKERKPKLLWSACLAYSIISYIFVFYPAWQISFGYVFLSLAVWVMIKNRKEYQFEKIDIAYWVGIIIFVLVFVLGFFVNAREAIQTIMHTAYPGARNETGGKGIRYLFSYLYSYQLPFMKSQEFDTMQYASFLSVFPL